MSRLGILLTSTVLTLTPLASIAAPNVITDWDEKAAASIQGNVPAAPRVGPVGATRIMAVMHIAMFEAVNAVESKYTPYKGEVKADPGCSEKAAAATAAAKVLIKMHPESATKTQQELDTYLAAIPAGEAKDRGIKLGDETATRVIALRANDGNDKEYDYRPRTQPGVYVQTMPTVSWEHATMQPFVLTSPSQFRPGPPPDLRASYGPRTITRSKTLAGRTAPRGRHASPRMQSSGSLPVPPCIHPSRVKSSSPKICQWSRALAS